MVSALGIRIENKFWPAKYLFSKVQVLHIKTGVFGVKESKSEVQIEVYYSVMTG